MHKRLFIAIKINPRVELLNKIDFLENNLSHELINWIRKDHYHLTLKFLGEVPEKQIPIIKKALQNTCNHEAYFTMEIISIGVFGSAYNPRVLWLGVNGKEKIEGFYKRLALELKKIGFYTGNQNFVPHISIARIKKISDKKFFQMLLKKSKFENIQTQVVNEIILYESVLSTKGAEYQLIEAFDLQR